MTGPRAAPVSSRGGTRPLRITAVYLFAIPSSLASCALAASRSGSRRACASATGTRQRSTRARSTAPSSSPTSNGRRSSCSAAKPSLAQRRRRSVRRPRRRRPCGQSANERPSGNAGGDYVVFRADDEGYMDWLGGHPAGYVVNAERNPKPGYLKLHHASCRYISGPSRSAGAWTERQYIKVCAADIDLLEHWGRGRCVGSRLLLHLSTSRHRVGAAACPRCVGTGAAPATARSGS